jgi:hypothetical protein
MNAAIAGQEAAHSNEQVAWLSFATLAGALTAIVLAFARLQKGFLRIREGVDEKEMQRFQRSVSSLAFMANLGILCALQMRFWR